MRKSNMRYSEIIFIIWLSLEARIRESRHKAHFLNSAPVSLFSHIFYYITLCPQVKTIKEVSAKTPKNYIRALSS